MPRSTVAVTGTLGQSVNLPSLGKAVWQDPNDGQVVVLFASGTTEVDYVYSADSGNTWSQPQVAFYVDDFSIHDNFDSAMDPGGNVHCAHRFSSSGCYTLLAKDYVNGGWVPSGVVGRGFTAVSDPGPARGFNGAIEVSRAAAGLSFLDVPGPYPIPRITAKTSAGTVGLWWVPNPHSVFPIQDTFPGTAPSVFPCGAAGGYPVFSEAGPAGRQIIYSVDGTGLCQIGRTFGSPSIRVIEVKDPPGAITSSTIEGSGYFSRVPFNPSMSMIKTNAFAGPANDRRIGFQEVIVGSSKHNSLIGFDLLSASNEQLLSDGLSDSFGNISNWFGRVLSFGNYAPTFGVEETRAPNGVPFSAVDVLPGDIFSRTKASGTLSDLSWGSVDNRIHIYFLINEPNGEQSVSRIFCDVTRDFPGGTIGGQVVAPLRSTYSLSALDSPVSGIRSWAPATREYTGGSGLFLTWSNFKALRHSARQFEKLDKLEAVVTQGSGLDGLSRIVFWDFAESIESQFQQVKQTTYVQHRTLDSGNNPNFTGPSARVGLTGPEVDNLFDDSTSTGASVSNGDSVTLEFPTQQIFNRFEIAWLDLGPNMFEVNLDASIDGVNFTRVLTIPEGQGGFLIKASSEYDPLDPDLNGTVNLKMTPFNARFVKVSFGGAGAGTRDVREIRLYGAHNTAGGWETSAFTKLFFRPDEVNFNRVEDFGTVREGEIPVGWRTYGDFNWGVRASGSYSDNTQNGFATPGSIYQGTTNGRSDGFAIRTSETGVPQTPSGVITSGVLEVDISVLGSEVAFDGSTGRTIAFDIRHDTIVSDPVITADDPTDDQVIFETITETGVQRIRYPARLPVDINEFCGTNSCGTYTRFRTTVPSGNSTLRWIYQRGTLDAPGITADEGSVWVDNVQGVGEILPNVIAGFVRGSTFFESGSVNAFLEKKVTSQLPAYIKSDDAGLSGILNAYVQGVNFASGSVNAYTYGKLEQSVNAYLVGVLPSLTVNAYVLNSGSSEFVNAHVQNRANEYVNAYLLNNAVGQVVNAFIQTPEFAKVNAFVKAPVLTTGNINAYLKANGNQDFVNAYMLGSGLPSGTINAFIMNDGVATSINGFLARGDNARVAAYVGGAIPISGVINAWTSGVAAASSNVNSYVFGISGVASGSVNAYLVAVDAPNGRRNAFVIGFGDDSQCNFPLVTVPTVTIPSGNFFG